LGANACVYVYRDEAKRPYYVGSGTLRRPYVRAGHPPLPSDPGQIRVKPMESRQAARELEELLLAKWRLQSEGGLLVNRVRRGHRKNSRKGVSRPTHIPLHLRAKRGEAEQRPYCVYIYRDESKRPYYVGSGRRRRPFDRNSRNCPVPIDTQQIRVKFVATKEESLKLELLLIAKWKRRVDGGLLVNKSLGGRGPLGVRRLGVSPSVATRAKMSAAKTGWSPPPTLRELARRVHAGRVKSPEERANISKANKASEAVQAQVRRCQELNRKPVSWRSPGGVVVVATQRELIGLFPDEHLLQGALSRVMNGLQSHHRGWTLAELHTLSVAA
jgi:hypothetical protein